MIGFTALLAASIVLLVFTALNLRNIVLLGRTSAYGHVYTFRESPIAFVISTVVTVLAFLFGLVGTLAGLAIIFGFDR